MKLSIQGGLSGPILVQSGADGEIVLQSGAGSRAVLLQNANGELVNFVVADDKVKLRLSFDIF